MGAQGELDEGTKEIEQQKIILKETVETLSNISREKEEEAKQLDSRYQERSRKVKELEQEKLIQDELLGCEQKRTRKIKLGYILLVFCVASISTGFLVNLYLGESNERSHSSPVSLSHYNSPFLIQNLRGDVVNTYVSWNVPSETPLTVDIINQAGVTPDKLFAVKDAILSKENVTLQNSLLHKTPLGISSVYYKGWQGALAAAALQKTMYFIPQQFKISDDLGGAGDIVITITDDLNADGLSGFTRDTVEGNQILKAAITIYGANQLSAGQLGAITRHEFGHALGLAHSTDPEDLMHATIQTQYPYISGCDVDAVSGLYNGDKQSLVVCQN